VKYFSILRNREEVFVVGRQSSFLFLSVTDIPVGDEGRKSFLKKIIARYGNINEDKPLTDEVFHLICPLAQ
jgi:hypothetical protein